MTTNQKVAGSNTAERAKKVLQIRLNKKPGYLPERTRCNRTATRYSSTLSIAFAAWSPIPGTRWEYVPRCVRRAGARGHLRAHDLAPATGPVMRNDGPKHGDERFFVDRLPPMDSHSSS